MARIVSKSELAPKIIEFRVAAPRIARKADERGMVTRVRCQVMELGEPDASGRRRPVPKPGEQFLLETDLVITAIGSGANPLLTRHTPGLETNKWGYIRVNDCGATSHPAVWAGGDIVTGSATVIQAMGAGKRAAADIQTYLTGTSNPWPETRRSAAALAGNR